MLVMEFFLRQLKEVEMERKKTKNRVRFKIL
jgi:hypothetical protein